MKINSYSVGSLLKNYGMNFTSTCVGIAYIVENIIKKVFSNSGILFDIDIARFKEKAIGRTRKIVNTMRRSGFKDNTDLKRTIKHGAILYIVIALLSIPVVISATQHHTLDYVPPLVIRPPSSVELQTEFESVTFSNTAEFLIQERTRLEVEAALAALPPFYLPIMKASRAYEVDAALIRAIIMAESSNNPKAVSHRGAKGLMQLMPITARSLGIEDAFNPELNIDAGVRYLKRLLDRFGGNVELALAAYNAGSRYVRKYGGVPPFRATRIYIRKVLQYRQMYEKETAMNEVHLSIV